MDFSNPSLLQSLPNTVAAMQENPLLKGTDTTRLNNEINYAGVRAIATINERIKAGNPIDSEWLRTTTNTLLVLSNSSQVPDFMSSESRNAILNANAGLITANRNTPDRQITLTPEQEELFEKLQDRRQWSEWNLPEAPTREQVRDAYRRNGGSSEGIGQVLNALMRGNLDGAGHIPPGGTNHTNTTAPAPEERPALQAPDFSVAVKNEEITRLLTSQGKIASPLEARFLPGTNPAASDIDRMRILSNGTILITEGQVSRIVGAVFEPGPSNQRVSPMGVPETALVAGLFSRRGEDSNTVPSRADRMHKIYPGLENPNTVDLYTHDLMHGMAGQVLEGIYDTDSLARMFGVDRWDGFIPPTPQGEAFLEGWEDALDGRNGARRNIRGLEGIYDLGADLAGKYGQGLPRWR